MKRLWILLILSMVVMGLASAATPASLQVQITKYEPFPAEPGRYVDMWITVKNVGNADASNVMIELLPEYPFSLDTGVSASKSVGTLVGGQQAIVNYRLRVDVAAVQGNNWLSLRTKFGTTDWLTQRFDINVQAQDSILSITHIRTEPSSMEPGKVSNIIFVLDNMADSFLKDITIGLDLSDPTLPFAPFNSTTEKRVQTLDAGESSDVIFNVVVLPDADSGIYKIPATISYADSVGTEYMKSEVVGVIVGSSPNLRLELDETDLYSSGKAGELTVKLVNAGLTDLKFLTISLEESELVEVVEPSELYIGDLDSDDYESITFKIYVKRTSEKEVPLTFNLEYLDANNNKYTESKVFDLRMYSALETRMFGLVASKAGSWVVLGILVLAGGGFVFYRFYWKKR